MDQGFTHPAGHRVKARWVIDCSFCGSAEGKYSENDRIDGPFACANCQRAHLTNPRPIERVSNAFAKQIKEMLATPDDVENDGLEDEGG